MMSEFQGNRIAYKLLAGVGAMALSTSAFAQEAAVAPQQSQQEASQSSPGEIVVTATRRNESLQDVPVTITAVTNKDLQQNNITQFRDIQAISPGLVIEDRGAQGNVTSLRGISSTVNTSSPQGVVIYFNEAHIEDSLAFQSIYDLGQIEVLRGPQGTLRGVAAPAGSITVTTHRPDLNEFGATMDGTFTDQSAVNAWAAVNVPLMKDVLAVRVAGLYDHNENGFVHSIGNNDRTKSETKSGRVSLLFQPIPALNIFAAYQYLRNNTDNLALVQGPGAGYNGPAISSGRRNLAVQEDVSPRQTTAHIGNLNASLELGDEATLSYIGSYSKSSQLTRLDEGDSDQGNSVLNLSPRQGFDVAVSRWTHEVRVDSQGGGRFFDYTFGAYRERTTSDASIISSLFGVPASFAPPTGPYIISGDLNILSSAKTVDKSLFASGTIHLPTRTDITGGARRLWTKQEAPTDFLLISNTFGAITTTPVGSFPDSRDLKAWVYDAKIVQHIGDDSIIYASYGRGFRGPGSNKYVSAPDVVRIVTPEKSDSYEIGAKGSLFNNRLRFGAAVFQQDIKGYISSVNDIPFCAPGTTAPCGVNNVQVSSLVFNGDARVRGFDLDLFGQITQGWTAQGTVSYAKGKFKNALIPCRPDLNGDGVPDNNIDFGNNATQPVYRCSSNGAISDVPNWNFTLQSEYNFPLAQAQAYVRGLFVYKGTREDVAVTGLKFDAQPILNVYIGARHLAQGLDFSMFAKNILNTRKLTNIGSELVTGGFASGYRQVSYTPQREVGVTARYTFGGD